MVSFCVSSALALLLHEAGHVAFAWALGIRVKRVGICWKGPFIVREQGSPAANICIALAGPLANLLFGLLCWGVAPSLAEINFILGLSNLVPVAPLDGWHVWCAIRDWPALPPSEPE